MKYEESIHKLPMREAVRYTEGNTKWTAADLKVYVDAHANALLEHNFKKGDKIALWMEPNQHKVCKIQRKNECLQNYKNTTFKDTIILYFLS